MWVALYVAAIILVNWSFIALSPWATPLGDLYIANIIVGFVFVLRDYAQRAVGHKILIATLLAGVGTYFVVYWTAPLGMSTEPSSAFTAYMVSLMRDNSIAAIITFASVAAFAISEMTDWAIYSFWKRPLQQRILVSSLIAVPLDTIVFQNLAGYYSPAAFATEVVSKALGVAIVWYLLRLRIGNAETPVAAH